jgi:4a-hydroxytetrahydrobiopterin dehydratase
MATRLDDHLVSDALGALTDWEGDSERITRSVSLDRSAQDRLLAEVQQAADAMDHHPEVSRDDSAVRFTLWTHSEGGVTELDIALASRIDDLVLKASGRGVVTGVAGAPTPEGLGAGETGHGRRAGGEERTDEEIISRAAQEGHTYEQERRRAGVAPGEPLVGVPAGVSGTVTPGVGLPDVASGEPEPGVEGPEGQGGTFGGPDSEKRE